MQSYAVKDNSDSHDETEDWGGDFSKDSTSKSNQDLDQDNLCYRSPECQQANDAQQIEGSDNEATGFNDQSKNFDIEAIPTSTTAGSGAVGPQQVQQAQQAQQVLMVTDGTNGTRWY